MSITFNTPIILSDVDAHGLELAGKLGLGQMQGIDALASAAAADAVDSDASEIVTGVEADLILVPGGKPRHWILKGQIDGRVALVCQRCLELTEVRVGREVSLAIVASELDEEHFDAAFPGMERWDHDEEQLVLADLIDEWMMLELPMVVAHEKIEDCGPLATALERPVEQAKTQTPFADLANMMTGKSD
ncbi:MAG: DUF177 domain-containing protein [Pseudomonadota bacterium]